MGKVIYFLLIVLLVSCGTERPSDVSDKSETIVNGSVTSYALYGDIDYEHGMHYKVYHTAPGHIFMINVTKDSLEVEMLKRSLYKKN